MDGRLMRAPYAEQARLDGRVSRAHSVWDFRNAASGHIGLRRSDHVSYYERLVLSCKSHLLRSDARKDQTQFG